MTERPLHQLEAEVGCLSSGRERILKEMHEMFLAMNTLLDQIVASHGYEKGESSTIKNGCVGKRGGSAGPLHSFAPKIAKLGFPCFDSRNDLMSWICWAEQFL